MQQFSASDQASVANAVARRSALLLKKNYSIVASHVAYLQYIVKMPWYIYIFATQCKFVH